jgi:hypothetical protein
MDKKLYAFIATHDNRLQCIFNSFCNIINKDLLSGGEKRSSSATVRRVVFRFLAQEKNCVEKCGRVVQYGVKACKHSDRKVVEERNLTLLCSV